MSEQRVEYGVDPKEEGPKWRELPEQVLAWVGRAEDVLDDLEPAFDCLRAKDQNSGISDGMLLAALLLSYEEEEPG